MLVLVPRLPLLVFVLINTICRRDIQMRPSFSALTTSALPSWCKHSVGSMFARGRQQIRGFHHVPVLPTETALHWRPPPSLLVEESKPCLMVDATAGGGSHSDVSVRVLFFLLLSLCSSSFCLHQTSKHRTLTPAALLLSPVSFLPLSCQKKTKKNSGTPFFHTQQHLSLMS